MYLVGCLLATGLIMQGLGKTERGEQGRDIDLTSLRSTMPASGPLQVSAPKKTEKTVWKGEGDGGEAESDKARKRKLTRQKLRRKMWIVKLDYTADASLFLLASPTSLSSFPSPPLSQFLHSFISLSLSLG